MSDKWSSVKRRIATANAAARFGEVSPAYRRRMHNINVFLWPNRGSADGAIRQEDAQILHWNGAEMTYWVVSDLKNAELFELAQALRGH